MSYILLLVSCFLCLTSYIYLLMKNDLYALLQVRMGAGEMSEILMAELAGLGYDSFLETSDGFEASVPEAGYDAEALMEILETYSIQPADYEVKWVKKENWNKQWEEHFEMTEVTEDCLIRAAFHQPARPYRYEIVITPKMSFGTGHHATTQLMIRHQLLVDHQGKRVFDAGSGTGILAIMAAKLGASEVMGCDIEEWAVENATENAAVNHVSIPFYLGTVGDQDFPFKPPFDIVLANINLNVILGEMLRYKQMLTQGGHLLLSGFYEEDVPAVLAKASEYGLHPIETNSQNRWASVILHEPMH